jgi:hypothetical protein
MGRTMKYNFIDAVIVTGCVLSLSVALLSCKPQYHIGKAEKHTQKALNKGAVINVDTLRTHDTITTILTRNDTTYIFRTVTNTVTTAGELRYITNRDMRYERRLARRIYEDSISLVRLQARLDKRSSQTSDRQNTKQVRAENRSRWLFWLILGIVIGAVGTFFVKNWFSKK